MTAGIESLNYGIKNSTILALYYFEYSTTICLGLMLKVIVTIITTTKKR